LYSSYAASSQNQTQQYNKPPYQPSQLPQIKQYQPPPPQMTQMQQYQSKQQSQSHAHEPHDLRLQTAYPQHESKHLLQNSIPNPSGYRASISDHPKLLPQYEQQQSHAQYDAQQLHYDN